MPLVQYITSIRGRANLEAAFEVVLNRQSVSRLIYYPPTCLSGLHLAAYFGLKDAFIVTLERSGTERNNGQLTIEIDVNVRDYADFTPLFYAVMGGKADFIAWLLSIDEVEVNSKRHNHPCTPIHTGISIGNMAVILPFIESDKADLNSQDTWGMTALAEATKRGYVGIVKALVESNRVDVNLEDNSNQTPLSIAAERGLVEVVRLFLGTGKVNANQVDVFGRTPLHNALHTSPGETARCLLESGQIDASLSAQDRSGRTPLREALNSLGRDHSITELILDRMEAIGIKREDALQAAEYTQ
ncbi:hypothetical protein GCG54_00011580 [Colletotrichum gloeosporioides]|uniref:Ankyrin repeat protein n=1 Tax=Colletotrichum gloeosporioides TaxID=474922 RepID=A0A8H4CSL8_COLGL|nr:uncharacterized protein GCG54_00011580 [Colletotrichum gloeosporioides]KAF3809381.1 hypothetical protein GCG54_00011580 [Colletotrichum gloeosporioides]